MEDIDKIIVQIKNETDVFNKARLIDFLRRKKDIPLKTISEKLKLKPQYLAQIMRLIRIPEIIVDGFYSQLVSLSHLFILARIKDPKKMVKLYEKILTKNLKTSQTEALVREILYGIKTTVNRLTEQEKLILIENITRGNKDIKVLITQTRIKSKIIIEIKSDLDKASNLLKKLF